LVITALRVRWRAKADAKTLSDEATDWEVASDRRL
jgi:hypothetical protein